MPNCCTPKPIHDIVHIVSDDGRDSDGDGSRADYTKRSTSPPVIIGTAMVTEAAPASRCKYGFWRIRA